MNQLLLRLVKIAEGEVGVRETSKNTGDRVIQYQRATWLAPGPWPWCAAFLCWCLREWLISREVRDAFGIHDPVSAESWRCRDALAYGWEEWASKRNLELFPDTALPRIGDIVTYDFSHIGLVVGVKGDSITTVEGNTNGDGSRDGDGVYVKTRKRTLIRKIIRLLD